MTEIRKKVLIIDDDKFLLDMYSTKFRNSGYDVEVATGSIAALNKFREGLKPDVVLMDLVMPVMDGLELLASIQKERLVPDAIKIVLSNQSQASDIEKAKSLGADSYIIKASTIPSEVVSEVMKVVESKSKK